MKKLINISNLLRQLPVMIFILASSLSYAQVEWITIEDAQKRMESEPRKIFVDVMTDWCVWCKKMDKSTFQKKEIADYLNANFYPVKFDAEQKEDIVFNDQLYQYVKMGKKGYHEFAYSILKGMLSYPSIVFIDENLEVIQPIEGYRGPKEFSMIISYFAGEYYKSVPWKSYSQSQDAQDVLDYSRVVKH
jgi:thioredoxin-related protein